MKKSRRFSERAQGFGNQSKNPRSFGRFLTNPQEGREGKVGMTACTGGGTERGEIRKGARGGTLREGGDRRRSRRLLPLLWFPLAFAPLRPVKDTVEVRRKRIEVNVCNSPHPLHPFVQLKFRLGAGRKCEGDTQRGRGAVPLRSKPLSPFWFPPRASLSSFPSPYVP